MPSFVPMPPQPRLTGLKGVIVNVTPPSVERYKPCDAPCIGLRRFINTESEFVGDAVIVLTPVANMKSVEFVHVEPSSLVNQKPPLREPI